MGDITPVSLFAHMIETRAVPGRIAALQFGDVEIAMPIHAEKCDVTSSFCEILARIQDRAVFDRARDQMLSTANRSCAGFAPRLELQRQIDYRIIGFCAAAGENNFRRLTSEKRRQPLARKIDGFPRRGCEAVSARRVAVILGQKRQHFLDDRRIKLGGRVVI